MFYSKYDVVKKTENTMYHWTDNYITDITTYRMSDYIANIKSGYRHKGEMRLCVSETKSRSGRSHSYDYKYHLFGYYAPVISKKEYRNGILVKENQTVYKYHLINGQYVWLPKTESEIYPSKDTVVIRYYTKYNNSFLPTEYINKLHQTVKLQWNSKDLLLTHSIGNQTTCCEYDNFGQVSRIVRPNGYELNYEYDLMQRLSGIKDKDGNYINKYKYAYRTSVNQ